MKKLDSAIMVAAPYAVLLTGSFLACSSRDVAGGNGPDTPAIVVGLYLMALGAMGLWMLRANEKKKNGTKNNQKSR